MNGSLQGAHPIGSLSVNLDPEWRAVYRFALQGSGVVLYGVSVEPRGRVPVGGLTSRFRDLLRPGAALRAATRWLAHPDQSPPEFVLEPASLGPDDPNPELSRKLLLWAAAHNARLKITAPGAQPANRRFRLAQTAGLYADAVASGDPAPRKRVAELQGRSDGAVRDDLHAARVEEPPLLTGAAGKGKGGGSLTDAAIALLNQKDPE